MKRLKKNEINFSYRHSSFNEKDIENTALFVKYAFDEESKKRHLQSVATHWEIERSEKNPLWNFLYAISGGEKIDCAIAELDLDKRKVTLSMKLLEEIEKKEALDKYGSEGSGKNLPFSSLSEDLKKKDEKK